MMTVKLTKINNNTRDGWERTFGRGVPEMNEDVKSMLKGWLKKSPQKILLFFMGHCEYSEDYAMFLFRELRRGNI